MSTQSPAPETALPPAPPPARPSRSWWQSWLLGWPAVAHMILTLLLAPWYLLLVAGTIGAALSGITVVTLPFLILGLAVGFSLAAAERWRLFVFTRHWVNRWPDRPLDLPAWRRLVFDTRPWRAQLYLLVMALWGLSGGAFVFVVLVVALSAVVLPSLPIGETGLARVYDLVGATVGPATLIVLGVSALVVLPLLARLLVHVDRGLARLLIGADTQEQVQILSRRVDTLTQTREAAIDSVDAERRRIERDLHDGPQQRLVAVAMDLGLARQRLATDPEGAASLLERAHNGAKEAIVEMRRVAQGIHPPVLTDRGLDAALSALSARSPVPVAVHVDLPRRPAARLEAIAYFCVSEALTNVAKHSRARSASVRVGERQDATGAVMVATVTDDGVGGADPSRGSGLAGLRARVAAVDGRVLVSSPPGGPTVVSVELPFTPAGSLPPPSPAAPPAAPSSAPYGGQVPSPDLTPTTHGDPS